MNLLKTIEEIELKLSSYEGLSGRITIRAKKEEIKEVAIKLRVKTYSQKRNAEEEVVIFDYFCKKNSALIINCRSIE